MFIKSRTRVILFLRDVKILNFATDLFFFFFQAEDGIRDHCVTGVQTCALPILSSQILGRCILVVLTEPFNGYGCKDRINVMNGINEIGRASGRERG